MTPLLSSSKRCSKPLIYSALFVSIQALEKLSSPSLRDAPVHAGAFCVTKLKGSEKSRVLCPFATRRLC